MSVVIPAGGYLEDPISLLLTTTAVTDVLSMTAGQKGIYTIVGIIIANSDASARLVSVWWRDNATDYLIFNRSVAATETVTEALSAPIRLNAKNTAKRIRAQAAASNVVTVTLIAVSTDESVTG